jgi:protein-S-isoprenylcysteine O-methyltransferase Ste14
MQRLPVDPRLARQEERDALAEFGDAYRVYAEIAPRFFSVLGN